MALDSVSAYTKCWSLLHPECSPIITSSQYPSKSEAYYFPADNFVMSRNCEGIALLENTALSLP
jgi:hypothetical protein